MKMTVRRYSAHGPDRFIATVSVRGTRLASDPAAFPFIRGQQTESGPWIGGYGNTPEDAVAQSFAQLGRAYFTAYHQPGDITEVDHEKGILVAQGPLEDDEDDPDGDVLFDPGWPHDDLEQSAVIFGIPTHSARFERFRPRSCHLCERCLERAGMR